MMFNEDNDNKNISGSPMPGVGSVVMDMQETLLKVIEKEEELRLSTVLQVNIFSALSIPTCITEQVPEKLGSTITEITSQCLDAPIFSKNTFSAFGSSSFMNWIHSMEISHLIVSGIEVPICIYQTCVDALKNDMKVTIVSDCVGARRENDAKTIIAQLQSFGCCTIPLETIAYSVLRDSNHQEFKLISKLIRERI